MAVVLHADNLLKRILLNEQYDILIQIKLMV